MKEMQLKVMGCSMSVPHTHMKGKFKRCYQPFPPGKVDGLQTRSVLPDDPPTPDKQYGNSPQSVHVYLHGKIRGPHDLQGVH